jgi:cobalamin biosynthesis protein CobT
MVSAMLLNESIGNVLGIPLEIAGFSEVRGRRGESYSQASPLMYLHRSYNTPRLSEDELLRRMSCAASHMTGNPDGDAIVWMYDRIKTRPEKRKLLVVLSDGSPACGRYGDQMKYAKTVVKQIEKEKRVQIVGIGIMDTNVRHIYKESYVIHSADTLETALLSLVDKKIA